LTEVFLVTQVKELLGREVIYELTQFIEGWLEKHNHKPQSFYDQMLQRQKEQEAIAFEREAQEWAKEREEDEALQEMIKMQVKRKEENIKAAKREIVRHPLWSSPLCVSLF
jgi:translation initiation factor 2-alpha kinase 4